ncbi:MAG: class I SAM-dependent methyltransferase [Candidatus Krumholzibacteria bacterium]|nr:class I SAM-dependent methyltransferase [Candidatus Krumholzibacteria bacterium]
MSYAKRRRKDDLTIPENTSKNTHNVAARLLLECTGCRPVEGRAPSGGNSGRPSRILDIPCGAGALTERLSLQGIEVWPADIRNILQAESERFIAADMNEKLPFDNNFFDAVACIDGIEHIERPFDFVGECRRVLKTGGRLVLSTPNISSLRSRARWFLTGHHNKCKTPLDEINPGPLHHISMISFPELRYMLHSRGFRITRVAANRIKPAALVYAPLAPFAWMATAISYERNEKDPAKKKRNREILCGACSRAVLFGETLIIAAEKTG